MIDFRVVSSGQTESPLSHIAAAPTVLVGVSAQMERLRTRVLELSQADHPVLISGAAGTGKSLVARTLHELGPRAKQLCAVVACHAFPETLLEVELFGCTKGSVVGASSDRHGVLDMVDGGTVILEGIETTSARTQLLLERFFETGRVHTIGTVGPGNPVQTRVIVIGAAPPDADTGARHHAPLWHRLRASELHVPTLSERSTDVALLSQFFAASGEGQRHGVVFSAEAIRALSAYSWPGNVAQLKSVVERLVAGASSGQIRQSDLPVGIRPRLTTARGHDTPVTKVADELFARLQASHESFWSAVYPLFMKREITRADLRALITRALDTARGNLDELVRVLNMPRSDRPKFERFLRKYDCEPTS